MQRYLKTAILAAAGLALFSSSGLAQINYADQDLVLAFKASGHNDFLVDLGPVSQFSASSTFGLSTVGLNGSDLVANFGGSLSNVVWATWAGNAQTANNEVWLSSGSSTPLSTEALSSTRTTASAINTFGGNDIGGPNAGNVVAGSTREYTIPTSATASFTTYGGFVNGTYPDDTSVGIDATGYLDDLPAFPKGGSSGPGTVLGNFSFDPATGDGVWSGASVAVPEPSTFALIAGFGLLAVTLRRRFARKAA